MIDRAPFLEILATGEKVGKKPSFCRTDDLRLLGHPETSLRAIRAKCIDCSGGSRHEVRKCTAVTCPLWPMRMGKSPFRPKKRAREAVEPHEEHWRGGGR